MDLGLKNKIALVTGGSYGIGRAIALALADEGCQVAICARGAERLEKTAAEIRAKGGEALRDFRRCDPRRRCTPRR